MNKATVPFYYKKITSLLAILALALFIMPGCGSGNTDPNVPKQETAKYGTIHISVDESFKPVIDSQIKVYESSYPETKIIAEYKPEAECLKDLSSDSTRMVIVTRGLSPEEKTSFTKKFDLTPGFGILAYDAVALIVNKESADSVFTVADIEQMLLGNSAYKQKIVMDGLTATSTVRFAIDSILKGKPLGTNVVAAKSSPEVIEYVSKDKNAIGMIGVSWAGNSDDKDQLSFSDKIKVVSLQCDLCEGQPYVKPYQANIALGRYPFRRALYYIIKENYSGLGNGFVNFMTSQDRGQLIFRRAYLIPALMRITTRAVKM